MNGEATTAGLGQRLGARVIDWLLVLPIFVVAQVVGVVLDNAAGAIIGLLLYLAALGFALYNQVIRLGQQGSSFGKQWLSLRAVDQQSREPIGIGRALARELVLGLLAAICLIPAIVNLVVTAKDPRRQGWHDKAAASLIVPSGAPPAGSGGSGNATAAAPSHATEAPPPPVEYNPTSPPPPGTLAPPPPTPADDEPDAETISRPPAAPATEMVAPPPGVVPEPPSTAPTQETPMTGTPVEETAMAGPRTPHSGVEIPAGWTITAPDGSRRVIDGPLLVGRDPDPALVGGAAVWPIDDPRLTMSKTHALLGIDDGVAWVEDWHSTNGVALHRGEAQLVIEPHARTPLRDGDVIEFGAFKVTVEAGP